MLHQDQYFSDSFIGPNRGKIIKIQTVFPGCEYFTAEFIKNLVHRLLTQATESTNLCGTGSWFRRKQKQLVKLEKESAITVVALSALLTTGWWLAPYRETPSKQSHSVENGPWASGCGQLGKPIQALIFVFRPSPADHSPGAPSELSSWEAHVSRGLLRASWHCGDSHVSLQTQQQSLLGLLLSYVPECLTSMPLSHWNIPPPQLSLFL